MSESYKVLGPDLVDMKGKTLRNEPQRLTMDFVKILLTIMENLHEITLTVDRILFLVTYVQDIGIITVKLLSMRMVEQLANKLLNVATLHSWAGCHVHSFLIDMEFNKLLPHL